jgi:hypothetical protein
MASMNYFDLIGKLLFNIKSAVYQLYSLPEYDFKQYIM